MGASIGSKVDAVQFAATGIPCVDLNGGVLESDKYLADRGEVVHRYWINLHPPS